MSEAAAQHCPNCNAANPLGAKFCASCRAPLGATAGPQPQPSPPPPPPPPRPNLGGMVGQMAGKTVTKQIAGDATAVYAHIAERIKGLPGTDVQQDVPPQQLSAKVSYKDFVTTAGVVIEVDTLVTVGSTGPGQSQVSVTSRTDMGSTKTIWMYNMFFALCGLFILPFPIWILVLVLGTAMGLWMVSSTPGQNVTKGIFDDLSANAAGLEAAPVTPATSPGSPGPQPANSAAPGSANSTAQGTTPSSDSGEAETFARIKKLAELRDAGAISAEDFEAKKVELLARI